MSKLLAGKTAIVTGAGSGIGRAIAYRFADEGANVVASDVNEEGGGETVAGVQQRKGRAIFVRADASRSRDCEATVRAAVSQFGALDIAVNNAGISGARAPTGEYPIESWDRVIAVNLSGVFYGMRYQIPAMLAAGGGSIVNMASILGQVGLRNAAAYAAAKHGIVGLTKSAALEYAMKQIRVNVVGPGFIMTPLLKDMSAEALESVAKRHAVGRLGTVDEVAQLVLWLSSDHASFVTGAYYAVDGGYLAQ